MSTKALTIGCKVRTITSADDSSVGLPLGTSGIFKGGVSNGIVKVLCKGRIYYLDHSELELVEVDPDTQRLSWLIDNGARVIAGSDCYWIVYKDGQTGPSFSTPNKAIDYELDVKPRTDTERLMWYYTKNTSLSLDILALRDKIDSLMDEEAAK